jgi:uncharacterized protein (TIGR03790 family)
LQSLRRASLLASIAALALTVRVSAEGLGPAQLGVLYNLDDPSSRAIAVFYAERRGVPSENLLGLHLGSSNALPPDVFAPLRQRALDDLPTAVESLALVWSRPYAVGCMSITSAFAAGYRPAFCPSECGRTPRNPLFDAEGWLPADTVGWWPAMLLPTHDPQLARQLIERGLAADGGAPSGTVYLVRTPDGNRNVRAATYRAAESLLEGRVRYRELSTPIAADVDAALAYFTGAAHVDELTRVHFVAGAVADHLTSSGGVLFGGTQTSVLEWLRQGATASYGSVSEPCNFLSKFPDPTVLLRHYLRGETVLEAYWKSVDMPGQGLFIGEPLARPYAARRR